jgi:hypothetical protein
VIYAVAKECDLARKRYFHVMVVADYSLRGSERVEDERSDAGHHHHHYDCHH